MKVLLKAAFGVVLVSLVLQPGPMWAQKGKPAPPETQLAALFRDNWDGEKYGDKIHSDGGGLYYTEMNPDRTYASIVKLQSDGSLQFWVERTSNRKVTFEFDSVVRPAPRNADGQLTCYEYSTDGSGPVFYVDPPSFLTGVPDIEYFRMSTLHKMTYNGTEWVYQLPSPYFDFRTMTVDATASALVRAQLGFHTTADSGNFPVSPNWSRDAWSPGGGVVKVTHPYADVWVVEPQSAPQLPGDPPLRGLGLNVAGFQYQVNSVRRTKQPGGNCDLGDWVMPFQITVTKVG
jgi:hypothetical protein